MGLREPNLVAAFGEIHILAAVGVVRLDTLDYVGVAVGDVTPDEEAEVDVETGVVPQRTVVPQRVGLVVDLARVTVVLAELEVPAFEVVLAHRGPLDLLLKGLSHLVQVTLSAECQFLPRRVVRLGENAAVQFVELRLADVATREFDDAFVGLGPPVGVEDRGLSRRVVECSAANANVALFPLFEEPQNTTSLISKHRSAGIVVGDGTFFTANTPHRGLFETVEVDDAVVLQRFLVVARLVVLERLLEGVAGQLERTLMNLRVVRDRGREVVTARAGPRAFRERGAGVVDILVLIRRTRVEDGGRQRRGRIKLDVVGAAGLVDRGDAALQIRGARRQVEVEDADRVVDLEEVGAVDIHTNERPRRRRVWRARSRGRARKVEHDARTWLSCVERLRARIVIALLVPRKLLGRSELCVVEE